MIIAATGHRPPSLGGYGHAAGERLVSFAQAHMEVLRPDIVISGMALGWDQAVAWAAVHLGIPFYAYVPGMWQADSWPEESKRTWRRLLDLADGTKVCTPATRYEGLAMQVRNMAMVDDCTALFALWNGQPGGTANAISYARQRIEGRQRRPVLNLWGAWNG